MLAEEKIEKIEEVNQLRLTDVLFYLTYLTDKCEVDEAEDKFQETLRKAKRGR